MSALPVTLIALLALAPLAVSAAGKAPGGLKFADPASQLCAARFEAGITDDGAKCPEGNTYDPEASFCLSDCPLTHPQPSPIDVTMCAKDCRKDYIAKDGLCAPLRKCSVSTNVHDKVLDMCCVPCKNGFVANGTLCLANCRTGYIPISNTRCRKIGGTQTLARSNYARTCSAPMAAYDQEVVDRDISDPECIDSIFIGGKCIEDCGVPMYEPTVSEVTGDVWCTAYADCKAGHVKCGSYCLDEGEYSTKPEGFCGGVDDLITLMECPSPVNICDLTDY